jgi:hypothetical protein
MGSGDVEATGMVTQQTAPVDELAEGPPDHPSPGQDGETLLTRRPHDDFVVHAMRVGPLTAALRGEGTVEDRHAQAW